jgi:putative FmdB family regulatory protein
MPTYEYECKSCGHSFEAFQSMKDEPIKVCPECGREVRRLINGGGGIIFKGSGFYVTDKGKGGNAKDPGKSSAPAAPGSEGSKAPAASGSGESKSPGSGTSGEAARSPAGEGKSSAPPEKKAAV